MNAGSGGKIIIHLQQDICQVLAAKLVGRVIEEGMVSANGTQYCYVTRFCVSGQDLNSQVFCVVASRRGNTHTFKVWRDEDEAE